MKTKLATLLYTPSFFLPGKAQESYSPNIAAAAQEGAAYGLEHKLTPGALLLKQGRGHALMITDLQEDFRDKGRLPVTGTDAVVERVCARIINGVVSDHYAGFIYSLDGHPFFHRSFDYSWIDKDGRPLDLSKHGKAAVLTLVDEKKAVFKATAFGPNGPYEVGFYQSRFDPRDAVDYWKHLQATGQGDIWVFVPHCLLGTDGTNLHPLLVETLAFACAARGIQPTIIGKGHIYNTDWFGPLEPCRPNPNHPQGGFQKEIIDTMKGSPERGQFVSTEFCGVAEDFCDYWMKKQVLNKLKGTEFVTKLAFLEDCTAPIIPDAPHVQALNDEARAEGVKFITHAALMA